MGWRLAQLASLEIKEEAPAIQSEGSRPNTWNYVDIRDLDVGTTAAAAQRAVADAGASREIEIPSGYSFTWSGEFESMQRAKQRLLVVVPVTLLLTLLSVYLNTQSPIPTMIVLFSVPLGLDGAVQRLRPKTMTATVIVAGLFQSCGKPVREPTR